jgi:hypothetical protein
MRTVSLVCKLWRGMESYWGGWCRGPWPKAAWRLLHRLHQAVISTICRQGNQRAVERKPAQCVKRITRLIIRPLERLQAGSPVTSGGRADEEPRWHDVLADERVVAEESEMHV